METFKNFLGGLAATVSLAVMAFIFAYLFTNIFGGP